MLSRTTALILTTAALTFLPTTPSEAAGGGEYCYMGVCEINRSIGGQNDTKMEARGAATVPNSSSASVGAAAGNTTADDLAAQAAYAACLAANATAAAPTPCGFVPFAEPGAAAAAGLGVPPVDPQVVARAAVARLPIPMPEAKVGPDPSANEWNMAAVGYPLWFWIDGPDQHSTTVTEQGITLTLTAKRQTTRFVTGDGNRIHCGTSTPWTPNTVPGTPSPTCGHVYQRPSLPNGTFGITATTIWNVEWAALGQSGTIPFERTGPATPLPVGELHAVRIR